MGKGRSPPERAPYRYLRNTGGYWTDSPCRNGHLALVNATGSGWFSLDDGGSNDCPWAARGIFQYWDEHCPSGISRLRAIRAIFCCSSLRAGSVSWTATPSLLATPSAISGASNMLAC